MENISAHRFLADPEKSGSDLKTYFTVRSLAPICSSLTCTMFSEPILRQSHTVRQRQINGKELSVSSPRSKLIDSVVTNNTLLPWSARQTEVSGGPAVIYAWSLVSGLALEIIHDFSLHLGGLLVVALRLWSCVFGILLTHGATALSLTHSELSKLGIYHPQLLTWLGIDGDFLSFC